MEAQDVELGGDPSKPKFSFANLLCHIRPMILFQATAKNGDVPVEKLKAYLTDTLKIPEEEVKIATGDQKELDEVDVMDPACKVNFVITVQALKEGWDCPFGGRGIQGRAGESASG